MTNTYGVPRYQEANPATMAVVTFPFLFAVMFGDYGHGSIILFIGTMLVLFNDELKKMDWMRDILWGRYAIFMMGCFSCYMGLLYNEWFAMPAWWFNSCYDVDIESDKYASYSLNETDAAGSYNFLLVSDNYGCNYPFGLDPTWFLDSGNILLIQNSFKMKMAVIIGVIHMSSGVVLKGINAVYFKNYIVLIFEVVTGLIILEGLFGWMDFLIFAKWFNTYEAYNYLLPHGQNATTSETDKYNYQFNKLTNAPSIYNIMISNFLKGGTNIATYSYDSS